MKKWLILLSSTLLLFTACTVSTEPTTASDNEFSSRSEESDASMSESESSIVSPEPESESVPEPGSSTASLESEPGSASESSPSSTSSAESSEESAIPNPDIGADPSPEEVELSRNAWNLQEHLREVLPLESYLYVCIDYVNSDGGDLIIGVVDEETVRSAVDSYTGAPCRQVIYQPAECSLAQVMDLSRAIVDLDFPDRTTTQTLPAEAWRGGGIEVIICADEDADADWIESEVLRLADEQEFPEEYIYFARREGVSPLPSGVNPDT